MTSTHLTAATGVDLLLDGITAGAVSPDAYAPDAAWDGVVPGWRFALTGSAAIVAEYGRWFAHPAELRELRRLATDSGEVVEYTVTWQEDGVPHAGRHVHVLTVDGDTGHIAEEHVWCGGRWPASLLAEMEAAGR
ncbi:MAG: hypothetical protein WKF43_04080 [Acidimicrobiales bacterium]